MRFRGRLDEGKVYIRGTLSECQANVKSFLSLTMLDVKLVVVWNCPLVTKKSIILIEQVIVNVWDDEDVKHMASSDIRDPQLTSGA